MRDDDRARIAGNGWVDYLAGDNAEYPVTALRRDRTAVARKTTLFRADRTPPEKRLADNMLDYNPASIAAFTQLAEGALVPGRDGGLLQARLRYFDPERRRAGLPRDVAALVSKLSATSTVVTLVNTSATAAHKLIVQGGAYGEHRIETAEHDGQRERIGARAFEVELAPGAGATLTLTMTRYTEAPTISFPWERKP
jgi:hypothetical protein